MTPEQELPQHRSSRNQQNQFWQLMLLNVQVKHAIIKQEVYI